MSIERLATDLASRKAGEGARDKAREHRQAAPVRTLLARALGVHTDERAWRVGARGERVVGEELEKLASKGWTVVHDVPVGERGANVDHVVVGPVAARRKPMSPEGRAQATVFDRGATLAADVLALRLARGWTQVQLAERSGIDQSDISRIERGLSNATEATLGRLAEVLDAEVHLVPREAASA